MHDNNVATGTDRIIRDPAVMVGKPVVKGTRIPVERVLAHLAQTPDLADLFAAYPELTVDDVKAVLAYARAAVVRDGRVGRSAPKKSRSTVGAAAG
jgi:uncharacterized protein (DUF433 family)